MQVNINSKNIEYEDIYVNNSSEDFVSYCNIKIAEFREDIKINDFIYISKDDKTVGIYKINQIDINQNSNNQFINIIGKSYSNEILFAYALETLQFPTNVNFNTILDSLKIKHNGDSFNLLYKYPLNIEIGTDLSELLLIILKEHGYCFVQKDKYVLTIEKINSLHSNQTVNNYQAIKYSQKRYYDEVISYCNSEFIEKEKWTYFNQSSSKLNTLVYKPLLPCDNTSLNQISKNLKNRELRNSINLQLDISIDYFLIPNQKIILNNFLEFNDVYYISKVEYFKDKITLNLKKNV